MNTLTIHTHLIRSVFAISGIAFVLLLSTACRRDPAPAPVKASPNQPDDLQALSEYIKKDAPPNADPASKLPPGHPPIESSMPKATESGNSTDAVSFTPPSQWKSEPISSSLRKAQYRIPGAGGSATDGSMVVFYFGQGQGGSLESNIDRWKKMFSTADGQPVPDSAVKRESHEVNGMKVTTLDIVGRYVDPMAGGGAAPTTGESRMLSAIVETPQGPWFFKGVGPVDTMATQIENFKQFVASMKKN